MSWQESIIGKTLVNIKESNDKEYLKLTFSDGDPLILFTEGDCCSHSWIEHIDIHWDEQPAKITSVEEKEMDRWQEDDNDIGHDVIQVYNTKFLLENENGKTGCVIVEYRNNSNGFYGGCLTDITTMGRRFKEPLKISWKELKDR